MHQPTWTAVVDLKAARRELDARAAFKVAVVVLAFFYCYRAVFRTLVWQWMTDDAYSYGVLIPPIAAYMAVRSWNARAVVLRAAPVGGALLVLAGVAMLAVGRSFGVVDIQEISLLPTIAGLVLAFGGYGALRRLWLPIAYLSLMMPVWGIVTDRLHLPFQLLSARLAAKLLHLAAVPVLLRGTFLDLPNITLEVARLCSGVNYLIGVAALSVPAAYLVFDDHLRRTLLLVTALSIAIFANAVRVALIGILLYYGLTTRVHGPGHVLQGLAVAIVGYAALLAAILSLMRWRRRAEDGVTTPTAEPVVPNSPWFLRSASRALLAPAALLILAGATVRSSADVRPQLRAVMQQFPESIGSWRASRAAHRDEVDVPSRTYVDPSGQTVELYLGSVVGSTTEGATTIVVDGFSSTAKPFMLQLDPDSTVQINWSRGTVHSLPASALFWYDVSGRVVADGLSAKLWTLWHHVSRQGRAPFAVIVAAPGSSGDDGQVVPSGLSSFARDLLAARDAFDSAHP